MARPESVALAGYFKTPEPLLPRIAALFDRRRTGDKGELTLLDPCAGDGEAVVGIANALVETQESDRDFDLYACELETGRHTTGKEKVGWRNHQQFLHGDAFRVTFEPGSKGGVGILFLNPPYDIDPIHGRLEQRFLDRFHPALMNQGVLIFIVPHYALAASASLLAREFTDIECYRFPAGDFASYKQVVVAAKKSPALLEGDARVEKRILRWADDASGLPELPEVGDEPVFSLPLAQRYLGGLNEWQIRPIDITGLLKKVQPWKQTMRGGALVAVPGIIPEQPFQDLLLRSYPVATPPRPAHIAAGIASGLFNGSRLEPSKGSLPPLLVKGVFDREYKTIEEKVNKDGIVRGIVQIQQPKLVTTVLNLETHTYHVLKSGIEESSVLDVAAMTVADLIKYYGDSMMAVMERQCPILYDPRRDAASISLVDSPRKLFTAQAHATKAIIKLLGGPNLTKAQRKGKTAILLGEIGCGKTTVAAMASETIGARRVLVMCPPHLLKGWSDQIAAILSDAIVKVLANVDDLDELAAMTTDKTVIAVLSREVSKLTHGWEGVGALCSKCGSPTPNVDLAKKRSVCEHTELLAGDVLAKVTRELALKLSAYAPDDTGIHNVLCGRFDRIRLAAFDQRERPAFPGLEVGSLDKAIDRLVEMKLKNEGDRDSVDRALVLALLASADSDRIVSVARRLVADPANNGWYSTMERDLILLLRPGSAEQSAYIADQKVLHIQTAIDESVKGGPNARIAGMAISWESGSLVLDGLKPGSLNASCRAIGAIGRLAHFHWAAKCGEPLFGAVPEPRRVALARHIVRYHRDLFDFLVLDEGHEYGTEGSAQERSAHRLTSLGIPTILMTGTIMNGYAASLFTNMWALSPSFREEFDRDEMSKFVDRYGYRKRLVEDRDKETGEIVEFGSMSDRITRTERIIGNAPGILPLFLLRHLLTISVTLHKSDLAIDLPACRQQRHSVEPTEEQSKRYKALQRALIERIRRDQFQPDAAGKLFGQLAELPSYLDRATSDTGNVDGGMFEIRYPESIGGELVTSQAPFDSDTILPKEAWMLNLVERELAEGRRVMVFSWHVNLIPRLTRLIEERVGKTVATLYADKVPTGKRQDWIDREIIKKGRRVLVTNPVAIQTGLNNLVHFASEVWMENPACGPIIFRQAVGRIDRIGQALETRVHFPVYKGTLQEQLYDLLMKKVAVSVSTDGLDPESSLQAAGVGEDEYLAGLSIGKQLWRMLTQGTLQAA